MDRLAMGLPDEGRAASDEFADALALPAVVADRVEFGFEAILDDKTPLDVADIVGRISKEPGARQVRDAANEGQTAIEILFEVDGLGTFPVLLEFVLSLAAITKCLCSHPTVGT